VSSSIDSLKVYVLHKFCIVTRVESYDQYSNLFLAPYDEEEEVERAVAASLAEAEVPTETSTNELIRILTQFQRDYIAESELTCVLVQRSQVFGSAQRAIRRKTFSYFAKPVIEFCEEEASDSGGPRREFFR